MYTCPCHGACQLEDGSMEHSELMSACEDTVSKSASQAPRFLDWFRQRLRDSRYMPGLADGYVEWVRRLILFHDKRHPRDMQAEAYRVFLDHVRGCGSYGWAEQQEARDALVFLYQEMTGKRVSPGNSPRSRSRSKSSS